MAVMSPLSFLTLIICTVTIVGLLSPILVVIFDKEEEVF